MASISAGTRNLKFMQRGTQLPVNSTPAPPSRATTSTTPATASAQNATTFAKTTPATQEEEEQWVLPTRQRASAKGKGKSSVDRSSTRHPTHARVVVTSESSYLAFVGPNASAGNQGGNSSDDDMDGSNAMANGRLTFGTLPSKQTLDTSIVDNREKMSHAKATTTASDRFAVFSASNGEASSSRRKGNEEADSRRKDERKRPARETNNTRNATEKPTPSSSRQAKQGFMRPSNFDDIPHPPQSQSASQQNDTPSTSSKRNGKKRKSDQLTGEGDDQGEVLAQGARARGKRSKKQAKGDPKSSGTPNVKTEKSQSREMDEDAMAAEIAAGAMDDDEVEQYLEGVMQEMRDD